MRAESAVEPTRSENITVTWRRSARSSDRGLGVLDVVPASTEGAFPLASLPRAAMASSSLTAMPKRRDAKLLQVLVRQARENRLVYVILAEDRLVLPETQTSQPDHNVHEGAYNQQWRISSLLWHRVSSTTAPGADRRWGATRSPLNYPRSRCRLAALLAPPQRVSGVRLWCRIAPPTNQDAARTKPRKSSTLVPTFLCE